MSRLARRNRTDIVYKGCGGLNDLFDDQMKSYLRVNDEEYDFILDKAYEQEKSGNDEFMDLIARDKKSFSEKCRLLILIDEALEEYNNQK